MDFWCVEIASSPSSCTDLSVPSFLHSFLEDVLGVFYGREAPIIFNAVDDTIVVYSSSFPRWYWTKNMYLWCDTISSSPSSCTGLFVPSFSYSFLEDVSEVLCGRKAPIVFSVVASFYGVSTIFVGWYLLGITCSNTMFLRRWKNMVVFLWG